MSSVIDNVVERRTGSLQILVVDDHELVRQGLRMILQGEPGREICGEASTGREAVEKAQQLRPDLVIMDISMPEMDGLEATRRIIEALPETEILILTVEFSKELLRQIFAAGARGFVCKTSVRNDLVAAVESLSRHKPYVPPQFGETVLEGFLDHGREKDRTMVSRSELTTREGEVLHLVVGGKTNKATASALGISPKTVETHRRNIMSKLSLATTVDLVRYAVRHRIIDP